MNTKSLPISEETQAELIKHMNGTWDYIAHDYHALAEEQGETLKAAHIREAVGDRMFALSTSTPELQKVWKSLTFDQQGELLKKAFPNGCV